MTVGTIIFAILSGLAINEFCDLSPWVARKLVRWSARLRYTNRRLATERADELAALIGARPGKLFKLGTAFGFVAAALAVSAGRGVARRIPTLVRRLAKRCYYPGGSRWRTRRPGLHAGRPLDDELISSAAPALTDGTPVAISRPVRNQPHGVGSMLSSAVTRRYGGNGMPDDTIEVILRGSAGRAFGAFAAPGVTLRLHGNASGKVGKGLSGGRLVLRPDKPARFETQRQIVAGRSLLHGATDGELFCGGPVGDRFAVRNSGAVAVVEGVGDHSCRYMTGGVVVVVGPTGRNFAAGMSGGCAYVWRLEQHLVNRDLVDLEPLTANQQVVVYELVERHAAETGSPLARGLLERWSTAVDEFTAVVPRPYRNGGAGESSQST